MTLDQEVYARNRVWADFCEERGDTAGVRKLRRAAEQWSRSPEEWELLRPVQKSPSRRMTVGLMNDYLKLLWPAERIEQLAYDNRPVVYVNHNDYRAIWDALKVKK